jgi:cell wall-associated NlpC family hydrolase
VKRQKEKPGSLQQEFARLAIEWAEARIPYEHRGTTRHGCDCTGLLIGIARELGCLGRYELRKYPFDWNLHAKADNYLIEELSKFGCQIPNGEAGPGDIAVMAFGRCPAHCGVITSTDLIMAHSLKTNRRCTFGRLKNSMWSQRWQTTFRLERAKLNVFS